MLPGSLWLALGSSQIVQRYLCARAHGRRVMRLLNVVSQLTCCTRLGDIKRVIRQQSNN